MSWFDLGCYIALNIKLTEVLMGVCKTNKCVLAFDQVREMSTPFLILSVCVCVFVFLCPCGFGCVQLYLYVHIHIHTAVNSARTESVFLESIRWFSAGKTAIWLLCSPPSKVKKKRRRSVLADVQSKPASFRPLDHK